MLKELWEALKQKDRGPNLVKYAKDNRGKEIRFPLRPPKNPLGKHEASKRGHQHIENYKPEKAPRKGMTNHQRVIRSRARRMGISVDEYLRRCQEER